MPKPHDLWGTGACFDLVLLTPSERDLKHLRADYAGAQTLKNCLPPHAHLEGNAAIVVAAKIPDLPVIADVLLLLAGFKRPTRVLLARRPASPDVSDAEVLIAAERGDIEVECAGRLARRRQSDRDR